MGLATSRALARRGHEVLLIERFGHVHDRGSHSGDTRIFRYGYFEGAQYVRLMAAADAAWQELQSDPARTSDEPLMERVGLLCVGAQDHPEMAKTLSALETGGLPHETLDSHEVRARWPFELAQDWRGYFSPRDGFLWVAPCMNALREDALRHGATVLAPVRVREILAGQRGRSGDHVGVLLDGGAIERADRVVVAAGAYAPALLPQVWRSGGRLARVQRRTLHWFVPTQGREQHAAQLPCWGAFHGDEFYYGFPFRDHREGVASVGGLKVAAHTFGSTALGGDQDDDVDPETVRRDVEAHEGQAVEAFARRLMPELVSQQQAGRSCLYTTTPSGDFVVDTWDYDPRVVLVGGFSGHGFKFAPEIGEMAADLCEHGRSERQLHRFTLSQHRRTM